MEIEVERQDYQAAVRYGDACLARNKAEQDVKEAIIRETMNLDHERFERQQLDALVDQELRVRSALAEMHYRQEKYAACVEQLDVLLRHDPTRSTDYYNRARAYEKQGLLDEARRDYEKFLGTTKLPNGDERVAHAFNYISDRV
jgi:tetratricopeptide (TPR) repeat protein